MRSRDAGAQSSSSSCHCNSCGATWRAITEPQVRCWGDATLFPGEHLAYRWRLEQVSEWQPAPMDESWEILGHICTPLVGSMSCSYQLSSASKSAARQESTSPGAFVTGVSRPFYHAVSASGGVAGTCTRRKLQTERCEGDCQRMICGLHMEGDQQLSVAVLMKDTGRLCHFIIVASDVVCQATAMKSLAWKGIAPRGSGDLQKSAEATCSLAMLHMDVLELGNI